MFARQQNSAQTCFTRRAENDIIGVQEYTCGTHFDGFQKAENGTPLNVFCCHSYISVDEL